DDVLGPGKARAEPAGGVANGEPARVIEVEMRGEHDVDVFRREAGLCERVVEMPGAPLDAVSLEELLAFLVAHPGVDDHRPGSTNDERTHGQANPVPVIGPGLLRPHRLRDHAEHRAAVQAEESIADRYQLEVTEGVPLDWLYGCRIRPRRRAGGAKAVRTRRRRLLQFDQHALRA